MNISKKIQFGVVAVAVIGSYSCKPRRIATESDLASIQDGNGNRFGAAEQNNTGTLKYVEFKICRNNENDCINPFVDNKSGRKLRASFVTWTTAGVSSSDAATKVGQIVDDSIKELDNNLTAQRQIVSGSEGAIGLEDYYKTALGKTRAMMTARDSKDKQILLTTGDLERLKSELPRLGVSDFRQQVAKYEQSLNSMIEVANPGTKPVLKQTEIQIARIEGGPTTEKVDGDKTTCLCSRTPSRFFLKAYNDSMPTSKFAKCEDMKVDPTLCRGYIMTMEDGSRRYSTTQCYCSDSHHSDGSSRLFTMMQGQTTCSTATEPPGACPADPTSKKVVLPEDQQQYDRDYAAWSQRKAERDRYDAERKRLQNLIYEYQQKQASSLEKQRNLESYKQELVRLNASYDNALKEENIEKAKLEKAEAAMSAMQHQRADLTSADKKVVLKQLIASSKVDDRLLLLGGTNGQLAYKSDWGGAASGTVGSVVPFMVAMAKFYNFQLSCRLWKTPFESVGTEISQIAPEYANNSTCDGEAESDIVYDDLMGSSQFDTTTPLTPGVYARPHLPSLTIKAIPPPVVVQPVAPAAAAPVAGQPVAAVKPVAPPPPAPVPAAPAVHKQAFILEFASANGAVKALTLDKCEKGLCSNYVINDPATAGRSDRVVIGILGARRFALFNLQTKEFFDYRKQ